jgi:thiamine-monophosphate kinase
MGAPSPALREPGFDAGGPSLADTGESELLRRLSEIARGTSAAGLRLGSGDDAAVWHPEPGVDVAVSQDALVEGKDFRRPWLTPRQVGARALRVALSDLAGMGATPAWCTAALCAPGSTRLGDVLEIHRGLCETANSVGCAVVGGDVSDIAGPLVIDVAVGGTVRAGHYLRRDAGSPGDLLVVTGRLGRAAAGLRLLLGHTTSAAPVDAAAWRSAFVNPVLRLAEGRALVEAGVRCGGDMSDGLIAEASRTAGASGCGAELWLEALPVDDALPTAFAEDWIELALGGGEDFELLFASGRVELDALMGAWPALASLTVVGRLSPGEGVRLLQREGGAELVLPPVRSRHYA